MRRSNLSCTRLYSKDYEKHYSEEIITLFAKAGLRRITPPNPVLPRTLRAAYNRTLCRQRQVCQPNPCQNNFLVFFLPIPLVQKGSSIAFAFFCKTWQQRENIVAWSGRDEIECPNKAGVREVMGSIPVGDSEFFFVPRSCHVD